MNFAIGGDGYESIWHYNDSNKMMGTSQFNGVQRLWTAAKPGQCQYR